MGKKRMTWKRAFTRGSILTLMGVLLCHGTAYALEEKDVINILINNESLFESNTIGGNVLRYIGWGLTKGLAAVAKAAAGLYDTCFGFVDFTEFPEVTAFIDKWKPVFISLVCLSLLFIGILLCVGWEKKPKIVINLLVAVTVVTSSTWVIKELNSLISDGVRNEILEGEGGSSVVYNVAGTNIHDLVYLDNTVGLENLNKKKNAKKVYEKFTKDQFQNISINETVEPDDLSEEAEEILANGVISEFDDNDKLKYSLDELYDGVAWTDLLNEYYYRYTVDWGPMWMELLSLAIIYLFMSYKVIRCLYEIVIHQMLAYLYAANLNNNQKILKILDSLKDSYILLLMTTVMIKFYLLACRYITGWDVSGLSKGFILLFLAFAVIDGPNLVQKLTGADIGASDGMGKMMSLFYGSQMAGGTVRTATGAVKFGANAVKGGAMKGKELYNRAKNQLNGNGGTSDAMKGMEAGIAGAGSGKTAGSEGRKEGGNPSENRNLDRNNSGDSRMSTEGTADPGQGETGGRELEQPQNSSDNMPGTAVENPDISMDGDGDPSVPPGGGNISMPQGQNSMDQIGKGLPSKEDALNGMNGGQKHGNPGDQINRMMDSMDRDVSSSLGGGMNAGWQDGTEGRPLDTGGNIFKENTDTSGMTGNQTGHEMLSGMTGNQTGHETLSGMTGKKESREDILEGKQKGEM